MDFSRLISASPRPECVDDYQEGEVQGLRSNKENLQQVARLIHKLEKLSAQVETILVENE